MLLVIQLDWKGISISRIDLLTYEMLMFGIFYMTSDNMISVI